MVNLKDTLATSVDVALMSLMLTLSWCLLKGIGEIEIMKIILQSVLATICRILHFVQISVSWGLSV